MKKYDGSDIFVIIILIVLLIAIAVGIIWLETIIGVWLWKVIMVKVFGLPALSFWQFIGLEILGMILLPHGTTAAAKTVDRITKK